MSKILTIEDDTSQRKIICENLIHRGYSVLEAGNGSEGLKIALREHPDLILLDVRMPIMDGMTMMQKLREDAWGKSASIIILTNYDADDKQISQITRDMPTYFLLKVDNPIERILEKIQELLESKEIKNQ